MRIIKTFLLFFLLILFFEGCQEEQPPIDTDSAIPVRVQAVSLQSIQEFVTATGTIYAVKEALLKTEQAGYYKLQNNSRTGRPFKMGDYVRNGELLIALENPEYVNQVAIDSKKLNYEASEREHKQQKKHLN